MKKFIGLFLVVICPFMPWRPPAAKAQQASGAGTVTVYDSAGKVVGHQAGQGSIDMSPFTWLKIGQNYSVNLTGVPYTPGNAPSPTPTPTPAPVPAPIQPASAPSYVTDCPHLLFSNNFQDPNFAVNQTSNWGPLVPAGSPGAHFIVHKPDGYDFGGYGNPAGFSWALDTSKGYLQLDMHNYYRAGTPALYVNGDGNWFRSCIATLANITGPRGTGVMQPQSTGFAASAPCYWEVAMWIPPIDPSEPVQMSGLWPSFSLYTDPATGNLNAIEIDAPEMYSIDYRVIHMSSRTWNNGVQSGNIGTTVTGADLSLGWHVWGVWIDTNAISYYLDGKLLFTGGTQSALGAQKLYGLIMNGYGPGGYPWPGSMNPNVTHNMKVAYITCFGN